ncbi:MAG: LysR family transcriptional regulator [Saprospiraceae bacterium]|nr:LysR family transcriptional regulator [Saprospiraceae bacterium]
MGKLEYVVHGHIWLVCPSGLEIGPGRAALLASIHELGSISKAADALGLTYRQAWGRVKAMNDSAQHPLVERHAGGKDGGGTLLSPVGLEVLATFQKEADRFQHFLHT